MKATGEVKKIESELNHLKSNERDLLTRLDQLREQEQRFQGNVGNLRGRLKEKFQSYGGPDSGLNQKDIHMVTHHSNILVGINVAFFFTL